jgi:hypothetical protein
MPSAGHKLPGRNPQNNTINILALSSDLFHCLADARDHIIDLVETEGREDGQIHVLLEPDFLCHGAFAKSMALAADFRQQVDRKIAVDDFNAVVLVEDTDQGLFFLVAAFLERLVEKYVEVIDVLIPRRCALDADAVDFAQPLIQPLANGDAHLV